MVRHGLTNSRVFACCLICWLGGLFFPLSYGQQSELLAFSILMLGLIFQRFRFFLLLFLVTASFMLAGTYLDWYVRRITPVLPYEQREWNLTVLQPPQKYDDQSVYRGRTAAGWFVQFALDRAAPILPGTEVRLTAMLKPYAPLEDKAKYWSGVRQKLFGKLASPKVIVLSRAKLSWSEYALVEARQQFNRIAQRLFVRPYAALFTGILAGQTADLAESVTADFRITGLSHLIAVSGFNVTILMTIVAKMTSRLSRWLDLLITSFTIFLFIVFTGASSSVVRAGLLAGLLSLGRSLHRKTYIVHLLLITAWLMTLTNPLLLHYDIGFQLSFAAILGLIFFAEPVQEVLIRVRLPPVVAELLAATTAAQLTTAPIIAYYFGTMSVYSVLANLFIGSTVSVITIGGIPLVLIAWLSPSVGQLLALPFDLTLRYIVMVAKLFSDLPYAQFLLAPVPVYVWAGYYLLIGGLRLLWRPTKE